MEIKDRLYARLWKASLLHLEIYIAAEGETLPKVSHSIARERILIL